MSPSNRSYAVLTLVALLALFGVRKCSYDIRGDLMRERLIAECDGREECRYKVESRFPGCFDDEYGLGVFVALSKIGSGVARNSFDRLMRSRVSSCIESR